MPLPKVPPPLNSETAGGAPLPTCPSSAAPPVSAAPEDPTPAVAGLHAAGACAVAAPSAIASGCCDAGAASGTSGNGARGETPKPGTRGLRWYCGRRCSTAGPRPRPGALRPSPSRWPPPPCDAAASAEKAAKKASSVPPELHPGVDGHVPGQLGAVEPAPREDAGAELLKFAAACRTSRAFKPAAMPAEDFLPTWSAPMAADGRRQAAPESASGRSWWLTGGWRVDSGRSAVGERGPPRGERGAG
mmetsp:Transcript_93240/g.269285  ORF Transcript_93240/g.269285 Transcript_93240/m.269285 type:complete len:246 (+) Transcript_93240:226-963(+)